MTFELDHDLDAIDRDVESMLRSDVPLGPLLSRFVIISKALVAEVRRLRADIEKAHEDLETERGRAKDAEQALADGEVRRIG